MAVAGFRYVDVGLRERSGCRHSRRNVLTCRDSGAAHADERVRHLALLALVKDRSLGRVSHCLLTQYLRTMGAMGWSWWARNVAAGTALMFVAWLVLSRGDVVSALAFVAASGVGLGLALAAMSMLRDGGGR